jgi:hypothetical protein
MAVAAKKHELVEVVYIKDRLDRFGRLTRRPGMTEFVTRHEANALIKAGTVELSEAVDSAADCSAKEEDQPSAESTPQESTKKLSRRERKEKARKEKEERKRAKK